MSKNKFINVLFACLMAVLVFSCDEIKALQEKKVTSLSLESNLSKTAFLYTENTKGVAQFKAIVYDQNKKEMSGEKIVFTHNLPEGARTIEENNIFSVDLDSIKALGEFCIEAKSEKKPEISQKYTFSIDTTTVLNPKYSFVSSARLSSDGEAIELDENGNQIKTDNERLSVASDSISMIATGLNGICLNVSEEDFGRIEWRREENEKFYAFEKENKLFVVPVEYSKFGENDKSFKIKAVAGKKEKEITITVNDNVDEGLTAPVINDFVLDETTGGYITIIGDSVGNKNTLKTEIIKEGESEVSSVAQEAINYGMKYIITESGKYNVKSFLVSSVGTQSSVSEKEFNIEYVHSSDFTPLVVTEKIQSEKGYITQSNFSQFENENLVVVSIENSEYNMILKTSFESFENSEKNFVTEETIQKGRSYSKEYKDCGQYTFTYWACNNKNFGNVVENKLTDANSVVKEATILDSRDINSLSWFSESVSSASGNTSVTSKISVNDKIFEIDENSKIKFTVWQENSSTSKKTATLDKNTKHFEFTITDSNRYYVTCFVYVPQTKQFSQIKKISIFQSSPQLTAYPVATSYDSEQDREEERKVIITNTKNFNGQGRKLSYAWSDSVNTPSASSFTNLTAGGSSSSDEKYSLYLKTSGKKYLHLKTKPYNENIQGETNTYIGITLKSVPLDMKITMSTSGADWTFFGGPYRKAEATFGSSMKNKKGFRWTAVYDCNDCSPKDYSGTGDATCNHDDHCGYYGYSSFSLTVYSYGYLSVTKNVGIYEKGSNSWNY